MQISGEGINKTLDLRLDPGERAFVAMDAVTYHHDQLRMSMCNPALGVMETFARAINQSVQFPRRLENRVSYPLDIKVSCPLPSAILRIDIGERSMCIRNSSFLAGSGDLKFGLRFRGGPASWMDTEDSFYLYVSGKGSIWVAAGGNVSYKRVNKRYRTGRGMIIGFEPTLSLRKMKIPDYQRSFKPEYLDDATAVFGSGKIAMQLNGSKGMQKLFAMS
jgi:uncharacterized protein (AIM24 family)